MVAEQIFAQREATTCMMYFEPIAFELFLYSVTGFEPLVYDERATLGAIGSLTGTCEGSLESERLLLDDGGRLEVRRLRACTKAPRKSHLYGCGSH